MLTIHVIMAELYDERTEEFVNETFRLDLEHSLSSLSKWESVHEKPFLGKQEKTSEELFDYIRRMCLTPDVPEDVFKRLSKANLESINEYISSKNTATWFGDTNEQKKPDKEIITAELIYYWMFSAGIPIDCEHWHLNRLLTLIRVFNVKNAPEKKMSQRELAERNRKLNDERRKKLGSSG